MAIFTRLSNYWHSHISSHQVTSKVVKEKLKNILTTLKEVLEKEESLMVADWLECNINVVDTTSLLLGLYDTIELLCAKISRMKIISAKEEILYKNSFCPDKNKEFRNLPKRRKLLREDNFEFVKSSFYDLPKDMTVYVAEYFAFGRNLFWKFGMVNSQTLMIAKSMLSNNNHMVTLELENSEVLNSVKMIENSSHVANIVSKLGLSFKYNNTITGKQIKSMVMHCPNIKALHLGRCNISELDTCIVS